MTNPKTLWLFFLFPFSFKTAALLFSLAVGNVVIASPVEVPAWCAHRVIAHRAVHGELTLKHVQAPVPALAQPVDALTHELRISVTWTQSSGSLGSGA